MKLNKITTGVLAATCMMAGAAQANTLTVDLTNVPSQKVDLLNVPMTFKAFDPTLGILTGVTLEINSDVIARVDVTNNNTGNNGNRVLDVKVPASLKLTTPAATPLTASLDMLTTKLSVSKKVGSNSGVANAEEHSTLTATMTYSGADLALFTGHGDLSTELTVNASAELRANKVEAVYSNYASGYGHVTYTFTAAPVPEPETYAMLLAGLGLMGLVAKRKKRSA